MTHTMCVMHSVCMPTPTTSPLRELVQDRLGRTTLAEWVGARRAENASWVTIAADLSKRTDLDINRETLRRWMADADERAA